MLCPSIRILFLPISKTLDLFLVKVHLYLNFTMTSRPKSDITHIDILGQELKINDFVAYPSSSGLGRNALKIGKIVDCTPKMVKVVHVSRRSGEVKSTTRYPGDCVRLDSSLITLYILKHNLN